MPRSPQRCRVEVPVARDQTLAVIAVRRGKGRPLTRPPPRAHADGSDD